MARENSGWGYDQIAGALSNLGTGGDGLLERGGADADRVGHLLHPFFIHIETRKVVIAGITQHPMNAGCSRWREA